MNIDIDAIRARHDADAAMCCDCTDDQTCDERDLLDEVDRLRLTVGGLRDDAEDLGAVIERMGKPVVTHRREDVAKFMDAEERAERAEAALARVEALCCAGDDAIPEGRTWCFDRQNSNRIRAAIAGETA